MKTVQSHVLSSDPISLSDATSFLSAHSVSAASVVASHETCWFVRRALASFQELEQLHLKLKGKRRSESHNDDAETTSLDVTSKPGSRSHDDLIKVEVGNRYLKEDGGEIAELDDRKKKKKKKRGNVIENNAGGIKEEEEDGESKMGSEEVGRQEKKKKKKKRKNEVLENGKVDASEDKRKKRRKS